MSLTTVQLWQALQDSKIATAAQCRTWASSIVEAGGSSALENPQLLLAQLVKLGFLTPFQANALIDNDIATLTIGRHKLLAPLTVPGLQNWFEAIDPSTDAARWLYALPVERLQSHDVERSPPSLSLARMHVDAKGEGLQSFSPPAILDGYLIVAATPAEGRPLREILKEKPNRRLDEDDVFRLIRLIAIPLATLHRNGLVHGRLAIDQIWWDEKLAATLLRDPLFYPSSPLGPNTPAAVGIIDDQDSRIRYAAPEFTAPGQQATTTTDIYALGCLWWELLTGQTPYADTMMDKVPTAAAKFPLPIPADCRLSSGQQKCLTHMLAKNPATRFADANQLLKAFNILMAENRLSTPDAPQVASTSILAAQPANSLSDFAERATTKKEIIKVADAPDPPRENLSIQVASLPTDEKQAPLISESSGKIDSKHHPASAAQSKTDPPAKNSVRNVPVEQSRLIASKSRDKALANQSVGSETVQPMVTISKSEPSSSTSPSGAPGEPKSESVHPHTVMDPNRSEATKDGGLRKPNVTSSRGGLPSPKPKVQSGTRRSKKAKRPAWFIPVVSGGCVLFLGGLVWLLSPGTREPEKNVFQSTDNSNSASPMPVSPVTPTTPAVSSAKQPDPMDDQFVRAKSSEAVPWLPPRASTPYSLSMLPPGAQGFVFVQPKAWRDAGPSGVVHALLVEEIDRLWSPVAKLFDWTIDEIQEVAIGLYGGRSDGWPNLVHRLTLAAPDLPEALKVRLKGSPNEVRVNDKYTIYDFGGIGVFFEPQSGGKDQPVATVTMGPVALIRELAETDGQAGPLRRQMEQLWQNSDARSDFTAIFATGVLFADARNLLPSVSERVFNLGRDLFDEKTQAFMIATTLEPQWYGELRVMGNNSDESTAFLNNFRDRMKSLPNDVEADLAANPAVPYWRSLSLRFPQMLRSLNRYQRFGAENGQAVSNFYLPATASQNLLIASWMTLKQPNGSTVTVANNATKPPARSGVLGTAILDFAVNISFDQEPLDIALSTIADEVNKALPSGSWPVEIAIDGKAFELAGVTRNQQIRDFKFKNEPLRKLLTDIAARLNPDRTVKALTEAKQVVVWVLDVSGEKAKFRFTTRPAIANENATLTSEFLASP